MDLLESNVTTNSTNEHRWGNADNATEKSASNNGNVMNSAEKVENGAKNEDGALISGHVDDKLRRAIDIVVGYSRVSNETKERLKSAVTDVHCKLMSEQEACECYQLAASYFRTYYDMVEKLLNRANLLKKEQHRSSIVVTEQSGAKTDVKKEEMEEYGHTSSMPLPLFFVDLDDGSNIADDSKMNDGKKIRKVRNARKEFTRGVAEIDKQRIDECIREYCGASIRHSTKTNAIRKAVGLVLHDGCTGVDAARATSLTPRTVMKHVYIVRDALNLPKTHKSKQQIAYRSSGDEIKQETLFLEQAADIERRMVKMLLDEKFEFVRTNEFFTTVPELESKIDKLLREFSYDGDVKKIREVIINIFIKRKNSSELCKAMADLPVTVVDSYVRLLKGFLWAENEIKKGVDILNVTPRRRGRKQFVKGEKKTDDENNVILKPNESDTAVSAKRMRKSVDVMHSSRGVFIGKIDVLTLHLESGIENEEHLIKNVISYLISQQYRRSELAQTNMQICLEHVLLDGLSVAETLKIHEGPSEGVLEIYQKRCRDAFTSLTVDFPAFVVALNSLSGDAKDNSRKKQSGMANVKVEELNIAISTSDGSNVDAVEFNTVEELFVSIPDKAKTLLHTYIMKLLDANFPLEKRLIGGLLQMIAEKMETKYVFADKVLEDCVTYFQEKHSNVTT